MLYCKENFQFVETVGTKDSNVYSNMNVLLKFEFWTNTVEKQPYHVL